MLKTDLFTYKYIPAKTALSGNAAGGEKVLVVFHGLGDSLNGFTWMPQQLRLDGLSYLLVNAPEDYYGGYSWFPFTGGGADMGAAVEGIHRSRKRIKGLLAELLEQGVKPADIILFGFSQGCLMALDAGLRSEVVLGGICGVSGWLAFQEEYPAALSPAALKEAFLVTHGIRDPLLPFAQSERQMAFLKASGVNLDFKAYDKDHTILPEELGEIRNWLVERMAAKG
ncbi:MAG: serine esterase [Fibrobacteres bacterium]|nr:serine esterase [Fibrobacterota bacterium]